MPKLRDKMKSQLRAMSKWKYDIVLSGKSLRIVKRAAKRRMEKVELQSPLGKMRSRQERKATAKALKISFNPRYNAPFTEMGYKLIETLKDGKPTGYTKLVLEVK